MHTAYKCFLGMYNLISLFSRISVAPELAQTAPCWGLPAAASPHPAASPGDADWTEGPGAATSPAVSWAEVALQSLLRNVWHSGQDKRGPVTKCHAALEKEAAQ